MKKLLTSSLGIFLLIAGWCPTSFDQTSNREQIIEVPFDFYRNEIIVRVKVNNRGPFDMMLDTGTDPSAIDLATAKEIGLKLDSVGHQGSGGGTSVNLAYETKLQLVEMGGLTARNVQALAIDLSKPSQRLAKPLHGILGHSLLNGRIVQIDYPKRVVRFYSKSPFPQAANLPNTSKRTVLPFRYDDGILIDQVSVNAKKMPANLDTGSNGTFSLTPAAVSYLSLDAEASKAPVSTSVGYNGTAENREGKIGNVTLGAISIDAPTVVFFSKGTGHDKKKWGINIGNAFLRDFVVTIDYRSKVLTLERPEHEARHHNSFKQARDRVVLR
jgi:predicted aspartyl protease